MVSMTSLTDETGREGIHLLPKIANSNLAEFQQGLEGRSFVLKWFCSALIRLWSDGFYEERDNDHCSKSVSVKTMNVSNPKEVQFPNQRWSLGESWKIMLFD